MVMNLSQTRSFFHNPLQLLSKTRLRSSTLYGLIIILAMFAFEGFNFGTTNFALRDLLGGLSFAGIPWATLMALAFCGLDFAGIARLITQNGREENPRSSWYLFGAWLIAATFNAALTWWGVTLAISSHTTTSAALVNTASLTKIVPVIVAIMVWIIRILIIGSLSSALEKINADRKSPSVPRTANSQANAGTSRLPQPAATLRRIVPSSQPNASMSARETTYHSFDNANRPSRTM